MAAVSITIRLRPKLVKIHESRRYEKAPKFLREAIARHSKSHVDNVKLSVDINKFLQANSTNKYKPIKLTFNKTGERVDVDLAEEVKKMINRPVVTAAPAAKQNEKKADAKKPAAKPEEKKAEPQKTQPKQQKPAAKPKAPKQQAKPADPAAQQT
jgi:ribosomal protein L31E